MKRLTISILFACINSSIGFGIGYLSGANHEQNKQKDDRVTLSVIYQNMPAIGSHGETTLELEADIEGRQFRLKDIGSLVELYNPKKCNMTGEEIKSDLNKNVLYSTCRSFTNDKHGNLIPKLQDIDFDVEVRYFDEGGELGDWRGYNFNFTPKNRDFKLEGSVK